MSNITRWRITASTIDDLPEPSFSNLFTSRPWIKSILEYYNFEIFCIQSNGTHTFLPAAKIEHFGFTKINVLPFCDYIIPDVKNADTLRQMVNYLIDEFPEAPVELKLTEPEGISFGVLPFAFTHTAYHHSVDTSEGLKAIESRMDNSFLRGVRKAESNNLSISMKTSQEDLKQFYRIYCRQRICKFKKMPQPYSFFEKIFTNFIQQKNGFILEARNDSVVVASMLILKYQQQLYYKFGCSVNEHLNLRPNNLLFYELFKYACNNGFTEVGLGLSGVSDAYKGLVRFKEYMGGAPANIYYLRHEPDPYDKTAEEQLKTFTGNLTKKIVARKPDADTADSYSSILYPYFA